MSTIVNQYEIPVTQPSQSVGSSSSATLPTSISSSTVPFSGGNDTSNFASRLESVEKYCQDLYANYAKLNSDVSFRNLKVSDRFEATWGKLGGFDMNAGVLSTPKLIIDSNNEFIKSGNYQTGTSGFKISSDLVEAENIIARGTLRGATFAYDQVSAIGGQLMVANADTLASDMSSLDASTLTTKGDTTFLVNDILVMRGVATLGTQEEWLRVTSATNAPTYSVTRDIKGEFVADSNPAWKSGTPIVKQGAWNGTTGNKYTAPTLTGLTSVSSLANFQSLAIGSNDAKIKLVLNGTSYDNLSVGIGSTDTVIASMTLARDYDARVDGNFQVMQSFKTTTRNYIKVATFYLGNKNGTFTASAKIYAVDGSGNPTGSALATVSLPSSGINSSYNIAYDITFNTLLSKNTSYAIVFSNPSGDGSNNFYVSGATGDYSDGILKTSTDGGSTWSSGVKDARFSITACSSPSSYDEIASALQTIIRTTSSLTEIVVWSTDHFVITGVANDYSIKISTPSTGTDISGAGATKYLDLANGVSTEGGYGSGGWLRLIGEGTNSPYYSVFKRLSGKYNDYQETCRLGNLNGFLNYATNEYGIAIGDSSGSLTYDPTYGLRINNLYQTYTYSSSSTVNTFAVPSGVKSVLVKYKLYNNSGTNNEIRVKINSIASGYNYHYTNSSGVSYNSGQTFLKLCTKDSSSGDMGQGDITINIQQSSSLLAGGGWGSGGSSNLMQYNVSSASDVSTIEFAPMGNITGTIEMYLTKI